MFYKWEVMSNKANWCENESLIHNGWCAYFLWMVQVWQFVIWSISMVFMSINTRKCNQCVFAMYSHFIMDIDVCLHINNIMILVSDLPMEPLCKPYIGSCMVYGAYCEFGLTWLPLLLQQNNCRQCTMVWYNYIVEICYWLNKAFHQCF